VGGAELTRITPGAGVGDTESTPITPGAGVGDTESIRITPGAEVVGAFRRNWALRWGWLVLFAIAFGGALGLAVAMYGRGFVSEVAAQSPPPMSSRAFPHELHERLFPSCSACHDVTTGSRDDLYRVQPQQCSACHDGAIRSAVDWSPPEPKSRFFRFDHDVHVQALGAGDNLDCTLCHRPDHVSGRMQIETLRPQECFQCHGVEPATHYEPGGACETCHLPLASNPAVTVQQVAALPMPRRHLDPDFPIAHGALAQSHGNACATCHARETCERCHANAAQLRAVVALGSDARVAQLNRGRTGNWPAPASHSDPDWPELHGAHMDASCANCHAQETCADCHLGTPAGAESLPPVRLAGMPLLELRPMSHTSDFVNAHAGAASSKECTTCHVESFCTDCHRDERGGYHPSNFLVRHATDAWAHDPGCADCHSTEGFCRRCHQESGLSPARSRGNGYHDAQPLWILNHGNAARQGLDACVACHEQPDCLRCHSARTGWSINPHGPDFDPGALRDASLVMCSVCHSLEFLRTR